MRRSMRRFRRPPREQLPRGPAIDGAGCSISAFRRSRAKNATQTIAAQAKPDTLGRPFRVLSPSKAGSDIKAESNQDDGRGVDKCSVCMKRTLDELFFVCASIQSVGRGSEICIKDCWIDPWVVPVFCCDGGRVGLSKEWLKSARFGYREIDETRIHIGVRRRRNGHSLSPIATISWLYGRMDRPPKMCA